MNPVDLSACRKLLDRIFGLSSKLDVVRDSPRPARSV